MATRLSLESVLDLLDSPEEDGETFFDGSDEEFEFEENEEREGSDENDEFEQDMMEIDHEIGNSEEVGDSEDDMENDSEESEENDIVQEESDECINVVRREKIEKGKRTG